MMRFVRDFGRLLLAMLVLNLVLIWLLGLFGVWTRWANNISTRRDTLRGNLISTTAPPEDDQLAVLSAPLPGSNQAAVESDQLETIVRSETDLTNLSQLLAHIETELPQPITLFLPTDTAFWQLPPKSRETLLANPVASAELLQRHMAAAILPMSLVSNMQSLTMIDGRSVVIDAQEDSVRIDHAALVSSEKAYAGGVMYKIDRLLLPHDGISIDTPNGETELDYSGSFLTINGNGQPNMLVIVHDGANNFGNALVDAEGRWSLSGNISPGRHELVAYLVQPGDLLPLGASLPIILNVK